MPPQNNMNTATPTSAPQPAPMATPTPAPTSLPSMDALKNNPKFMLTVQTFVIYGTIVAAGNAIIGMIVATMHYSQYYTSFDAVGLVYSIVAGAIGSAVGGAIFYYIFEMVRNWIKTNGFVSAHVHDLFTLFWKPSLLGIIISGVLGLLGFMSLGAVYGAYAGASIGGLFIGWVIMFAAHIALSYFYAKMVSQKLNPYYAW